MSAPDEFPSTKPATSRQKALLKNMPHTPVIPMKEAKGGFSITFVHLGRKYYQMTLWASTYVSQRKWVEHIAKQQELMRERSMAFETVTLSEGFFVGSNKINCAAPYSTLTGYTDSSGRSLLYYAKVKGDEPRTGLRMECTFQTCGRPTVNQRRSSLFRMLHRLTC